MYRFDRLYVLQVAHVAPLQVKQLRSAHPVCRQYRLPEVASYEYPAAQGQVGGLAARFGLVLAAQA